MPLPGESCQTNEAFTWKARFGEHCNKYSAEAYQIFCTMEIKYPVVPKPEILAKQMTKMRFDEKECTTTEDIELCIQKWTIKNLFGKTQALSYQETQKKHVQQSMLPYGLSQTNTHSTSYDSSEHALAHLAEACFIFYCSRVVLDNTSPVQ